MTIFKYLLLPLRPAPEAVPQGSRPRLRHDRRAVVLVGGWYSFSLDISNKTLGLYTTYLLIHLTTKLESS